MSKKILLIDDEKEIVQIMKKKIQAAGYDVSVAYNGKQGLETTVDKHPDLILTDVAMPVMDGFAFYTTLKSRQDIGHIPVIITSAYGTTEQIFRNMGARNFLMKPFDAQTVLNTVNGFFQERRAFKILVATKMQMLMHSIIDESRDVVRKLDIHLTTNQQPDIVKEAVVLKPDLIILDVDMFLKPAPDEIIGLLRQRPELKETVILINRSMLGYLAGLVGGGRADQTIDECLKSGANRYVGLINTESFMAVIREYCR